MRAPDTPSLIVPLDEHWPNTRSVLLTDNARDAEHLIRASETPGSSRAAIVSISASDCRIDAAIHKPLAIEAGDAGTALVLGEAERQPPHRREVLAQTSSAGP